jgi:uncharacterized protein (TIGR02145 family)
MKKTFFKFNMICAFILLCFGQTYAQTNICPNAKDVDGHNYASQKVGKLCWFTTNLKTSKYANGTPIRKIDDRNRWQNDKTGAYAVDNFIPDYDSVFGKLYNFPAAISKSGLCPTGWRVPTDADWNLLISHFDKNAKNGQDAIQSTTCGDYFKDSLLWITQNKANNRSGLRVLPSGWRNSDGTFLLTGYNAFFWTSGSSDGYGICRKLTFQNSTVQRLKRNPADGYSVRCVKDFGF